MIYLTKITPGVCVYRKLSIVHGLNKIEESQDIKDFLKTNHAKEEIANGNYVIESEKDAKKAITPAPENKGDKKKKG
jgi:hypothetical protein